MASVLLFVSVLAAGGCNRTGEWTPADADHILKTVSGIGDARKDPDRLKAIFTDGSVPDKTWLKKSTAYTFLVTDAKVKGDTAVATVELEENSTGDIVGSYEWDCEKVDGKWKIKTSPIE